MKEFTSSNEECFHWQNFVEKIVREKIKIYSKTIQKWHPFEVQWECSLLALEFQSKSHQFEWKIICFKITITLIVYQNIYSGCVRHPLVLLHQCYSIFFFFQFYSGDKRYAIRGNNWQKKKEKKFDTFDLEPKVLAYCNTIVEV